MDKYNIKLEENQNLFFTSDLHFNHGNILNFCNRPFENIKQMNEELIRRWNEVVKDDDIIFVIGDFDWFPHRHEMKKTISKLNGNIYMMLGNHDKAESFELIDSPKFHLCSDIVHIYLEGSKTQPQKIVEIVLCHYPLLTWSHVKHSIQLFGHIHGNTPKEGIEFDKPLNLRPNQIDIGVDAHNYYPVSIDDVFKEIGNLDKIFKNS